MIFLKNKSCPFCNNLLVTKVVSCPKNILIPCLECENCNIYLYAERYYELLKALAIGNNRKLNYHVYKYKRIEAQNDIKPKKKSKNKFSNPKDTPEKLQIRNRSLARIKFRKFNQCIHYAKLHCFLLEDECDPSSFECKFENKVVVPETEKNNECIKSVILSYNLKCIHEEHVIIDVNAIFKVATPNGTITDVFIRAAYCKKCNQYIILKRDFKLAKQKGILLCQIEDKTPEYLSKHKGSYYGTESKVHSLGYNVIKQYGYTYEQRKIILANIIENYSISIHEILSMLDLNISRKIGLANYVDAVYKWKQDREFVANYKIGDCPEVIISKVIISSRK